MSTMNVSLEPELKEYASSEEVRRRGFSTASEYVRHLIRADRERHEFRALIQAGLDSGPSLPVSDSLIDELRSRLSQGE